MNLFAFSLMIFGLSLLQACREDSPHAETAQQWRNADGLDNEGYDALGFKEGFDRQGFDSSGCDKESKDRIGYACADIKKLKEHAVSWEKHDEIAKELSDERKGLSALKTAADANEQALEDKLTRTKQKRTKFETDLKQTKQKLKDEKKEIERIQLELLNKDDTLRTKDEDLDKAKEAAQKLDENFRNKEQELAQTQQDYEKKLEEALKLYEEDEKNLTAKAEQLEKVLEQRDEEIEKLKEDSQLLSEKSKETEEKLTQYIEDAIKALNDINGSLDKSQKFAQEITGENLAKSIENILASANAPIQPTPPIKTPTNLNILKSRSRMQNITNQPNAGPSFVHETSTANMPNSPAIKNARSRVNQNLTGGKENAAGSK